MLTAAVPCASVTSVYKDPSSLDDRQRVLRPAPCNRKLGCLEKLADFDTEGDVKFAMEEDEGARRQLYVDYARIFYTPRFFKPIVGPSSNDDHADMLVSETPSASELFHA